MTHRLPSLIETSTFFAIIPPPGKPDPRDPKRGLDRKWVAQSGQKGGTCFFYAARVADLREKIGKYPQPEERGERVKEITISIARKKMTNRSQAATLATRFLPDIRNELKGKPLTRENVGKSYEVKADWITENQIVNGLIHKDEQQIQFCRNLVQGTKNQGTDLTEELQEVISTTEALKPFYKTVLGPFLAQKKITTLPEYIRDVMEPHVDRIWAELADSAKMSDVSLLNLNTLETKKWGELSSDEKNRAGPLMGILYFIQNLGFQPSDWTADQNIESLKTELKTFGPIVVAGLFGPSFYSEPPFKLEQELEGRPVYGFRPRTRRSHEELEKRTLTPAIIHVITIIGADTKTNRIFYLDPINGSEPDKPQTQTVFTLSYESLQTYIVPFDKNKTNIPIPLVPHRGFCGLRKACPIN